MAESRLESSALELLLREGTEADIRRFFLLLRPPELADLLEAVGEEDRPRILRLMNAPLAAEVLRELQEGEREDLFEELSSSEIAEIAPHLKSDDAADLIGSLPHDKAQRTLSKLEAEQREEIRELLTYDEETAGGIMQTEVMTISAGSTVKQALDAVRKADEDEVGEIHEVFIVDDGGRLVGSVSPADLLQADPTAMVLGVADANPVSVPLTMDQEEIADLVREHDLAAIPVVDAQGVLVGQVLHDDVADVIEEEANEDIARLAGAGPEEIYDDSVRVAIRSRAPWLLPAFAGGLLLAVYLSGWQAEVSKAPILAAFLPVVLGMAGNVGTQTSVITVRGLALGRIELRGSAGLIFRQFLTGLSLGLMFGALLFAFAYFRQDASAHVFALPLTLALSICTAMTVGATMGVAVPLLLHRLGFDPAIAATPFVQTANDLTGAGIILLLAQRAGVLG